MKDKRNYLLDGEPWLLRTNEPFYLTCCDCGKAHLITVDIIEKNSIVLRFYRDEYMTCLNRQKKDKKRRRYALVKS